MLLDRPKQAITVQFPLGVPYLDDQVGLFTASHLTGAPSSALYVLWIGGDNILAGQNPVTAADNVYSNIQTLSLEGAKYFLWPNMPLLGDTPVGSANSSLLNAASMAFDAEWQVDLAKLQGQGIQVVGEDVDSLYSAILGSPGAYGFTNATGAAWCGPGALPNCAANNPNDFVFWDGEHPTTAADALLANVAYDDLTGVPEPQNIGLALVGFCGILAVYRRSRKKARII